MKNTLKKMSDRLKRNKEEFLLSEEAAMDQIIDLISYYDIDLETLQMTENTQVAGERILDLLIKYYRRGQLKNKKDEKSFKVIQKTRKDQELVYEEITAKAKKQMDKCDSGAHNERLESFMVALCKNLDMEMVDSLHATDLAVLEVLGNVFLLA